jgi:hypothetical protein
MMECDLKTAQEAAAGGSNTEHARVECPKKVENLQAAMSLMDDGCTYHDFCVSPFFILTKCAGT